MPVVSLFNLDADLAGLFGKRFPLKSNNKNAVSYDATWKTHRGLGIVTVNGPGLAMGVSAGTSCKSVGTNGEGERD
jgi:hypothetical protein